VGSVACVCARERFIIRRSSSVEERADLVAIWEVGVGRGDGECFSLKTALLCTLFRDLGQKTDRSVGTR
jgi:hypothetical protein